MESTIFKTQVLPLKDQLYRLALRITLNSMESEDIVQDTMIKVWNRREQWNAIESIEAYCFKTCRNLALDHVKAKRHDNESIEEAHLSLADKTLDVSEEIDRRDDISRIRDIVNQLPEKQKSCMQLRDFEGKPYKEIADILSISEEQVKINIYRARQTIKNKYMKAGK